MRHQDLAELGQLKLLLSARTRLVKRTAVRLHDLALELGIWSGGSYSPSFRGRRPKNKMPKMSGMAWLHRNALGLAKYGQTISFFDRLLPYGRDLNREPPLVKRAWSNSNLVSGTKVMTCSFKTASSSVSALFCSSTLPRKFFKTRSYAPVSSYTISNSSVMQRGRVASPDNFTPHQPSTDPNTPMASWDPWVGQEFEKRSDDGKKEPVSIRSPCVTPKQKIAQTGQFDTIGREFGDALDDYFFRQSRLPPVRGTAFDPRLTPLWAGMKLPL